MYRKLVRDINIELIKIYRFLFEQFFDTVNI